MNIEATMLCYNCHLFVKFNSINDIIRGKFQYEIPLPEELVIKVPSGRDINDVVLSSQMRPAIAANFLYLPGHEHSCDYFSIHHNYITPEKAGQYFKAFSYGLNFVNAMPEEQLKSICYPKR